jgi:hypothetical protein
MLQRVGRSKLAICINQGWLLESSIYCSGLALQRICADVNVFLVLLGSRWVLHDSREIQFALTRCQVFAFTITRLPQSVCTGVEKAPEKRYGSIDLRGKLTHYLASHPEHAS